MAVAMASRLIWKNLLAAGRERSPFFAEYLHAQAPVATQTAAQDSGGAAVQAAVPGPRHSSTPAVAAPAVPPAGQDWAAAGAALVADTVQRLLGRPLRPDEPFMSAGLDSLGDQPTSLMPAASPGQDMLLMPSRACGRGASTTSLCSRIKQRHLPLCQVRRS